MTAHFDADGVPGFLASVQEAAQAGLLAVGEAVGRQMQRTLSGASPSAPGEPPGVADGGGRRSIATVSPGPLHVRVGSSLFYMLVQDTGNWSRPIVAKKTKYLLIPLTREARRLYRKANFNARSLDLKFVPRPNKPPLLVKEMGKAGKSRWAWKPLFILKRSVRLPKRPWAGPALRAAQPQLSGVFSRTAARHLRAKIGGAA